MTILVTELHTLEARREYIREASGFSTATYPDKVLDLFIDDSDDIAREFFPFDFSKLIIALEHEVFSGRPIGFQDLTIITVPDIPEIDHTIQVANQLCIILMLNGAQDDDNQFIINNRRRIYENIIQSFNSVQEFQKQTSITQLSKGGLSKKQLGTFG